MAAATYDSDQEEPPAEPSGDDSPSPMTPAETPSRSGERPTERPKRKGIDPLTQAMQRFQLCGRCSSFMADCDLKLGRDIVAGAVENSRDGWLTFDWDERLRPLLLNAYSANVEATCFYLDGRCPECLRRFTLAIQPEGERTPYFRIRL